MAKEEFLIKLSLLEQQANQLEQQIQQVDAQIQELELLNLNISKLGKEKENEILAPIGKGIFSKSELKEKKFFVNVGAGVMVKKKPEDAVKVIEVQIDKLKQARGQIIETIGQINSELEKVVEQVQKSEK